MNGEIRERAQLSFDFTAAMRTVCAEIIARTPELSHIRLDEVAICFCQARNRKPYGMYASLTPLRFADGALTTIRRRQRFGMQKLLNSRGREMLYILSFYLPRFMDLPLQEKLITIFHELWHISPRFNGDIRRHPDKCFAHTRSQKQYDAQMATLADRWLASRPPEELWLFLHLNCEQLHNTQGPIVGLRIAKPRLIPCRGSV